jgi:hypothetical protein
MKIELILFHRQPGALLKAAAGENRFMVLKKGVTRQLPQFNFPPAAAKLAAGLEASLRGSQFGHDVSLYSLH